MQTLLSMIVPQLWQFVRALTGLSLLSLVFFACFAWPFVLPKIPETLEDAYAFDNEKNHLKAQADTYFLEQFNFCQDKFLISNCVQDVESKKRLFDRDFKFSEKAASELIRLEKVRLKALKKNNQTPQSVDDYSNSEFSTQTYEKQKSIKRFIDGSSPNLSLNTEKYENSLRGNSDDLQVQKSFQPDEIQRKSLEKNSKEFNNSISEAQQIINQNAFRKKEIAAQKKKLEHQKRMQETQSKRQTYLKKQNEKYKNF
jgi:hypothetical protein